MATKREKYLINCANTFSKQLTGYAVKMDITPEEIVLIIKHIAKHMDEALKQLQQSEKEDYITRLNKN